MALTPEQIDAEAFARWGDMKGAPLAMCRGFARARLFDSGLSTLTERGAKAWAGVDPQKLREGGAL